MYEKEASIVRSQLDRRNDQLARANMRLENAYRHLKKTIGNMGTGGGAGTDAESALEYAKLIASLESEIRLLQMQVWPLPDLDSGALGWGGGGGGGMHADPTECSTVQRHAH